MTDVHCHVRGGDDRVRELVIGEQFAGVHPWAAESAPPSAIDDLRAALAAHPRLGVGEIGLDRLKTREISVRMRELFEAQLALACEFGRPCVLHGAKCWGQVVSAVRAACARTAAHPRFLFHGFSRSAGLLGEIERLGGFISVGTAVLNDHAVNYRELVRRIPEACLVLETDRTRESAAECPPLAEIAAAVAALRGRTLEELEALTEANARRFYGD